MRSHEKIAIRRSNKKTQFMSVYMFAHKKAIRLEKQN